MSVLDRIAHFQGRQDEQPNVALAGRLAADRDTDAISELAANLNHDLPAVRSDCIKVLYEIGHIEPGLISGYADEFLALLPSKNNRLVWGAMTALVSIAPLRPERLCRALDQILAAFEAGSVITRDNGVKVLAGLAEHSDDCRERARQALLSHFETCRPKDVPQHAETASSAFGPDATDSFTRVLQDRLPELSAAQARRLKRVLKAVGGAVAGN